jgi:acyl-homoserine lactone acylase PvdQ
MRQPRPPRAILLGVLLLTAAAEVRGAERVTIHRDTWGVPHIFGDSMEAAAFGHGYAQAEDRLEDLLGAYLRAEGRAASVYGDDALDGDVVARIAGHARLARERYAELGPETRRVVEAYVAGVRTFMREKPALVPPWARPPEPHQVVALYRSFAWAWPWGQALGELPQATAGTGESRGSNQWAVGAGRSAEGVPIALIDPHLSWEPQNRLYEAHVHGGDVNFFGFSILGTPIMAVGHTDVLSLALTTGGPDCADVYEERLHPDDPLRYEYDGDWRTMEVEEIEIEVRTPDGSRVVRRRVERTLHGPIVAREGQRAFAARTAYDREIGLVEQWLALVRARGLGEFLDAMRQNQSPPQNVMCADVRGNLYYLRAGRVPRRPEGFSWDRPVPGWTSASAWLGTHPLEDLVQILNPPGGTMQNCNVSPGTMFPASPLTAERYPRVIYNGRTDDSNSRGRRMLELLGGPEKLTLEAALRIAVDTHVDRAELWQAALSAAFEAGGARFPSLAPAVDLLSSWNRRIDGDSRAAPLFRLWMRACRAGPSAVPLARIEAGQPLDAAAQVALLEALQVAAQDLARAAGRIDVPWGELHRIGRGPGSWPVAGCRADGISTLRSVRYGSADAGGRSEARGGQICTTVVLLRPGGVESYSVTPFGQSDDPRSPHYADQAERLFSRGELKPTWYGRAALEKHIESSRTLAWPGL